MEVVKVENVARTYQVGKIETQALRGVNLMISDGEFTALVGPSGSGKTTLLQMIGCLDQPTSGKVLINGKDVTTLNRNQRGSRFRFGVRRTKFSPRTKRFLFESRAPSPEPRATREEDTARPAGITKAG